MPTTRTYCIDGRSVSPATILGFWLWQQTGGEWVATVNAKAEDFCQDFQGHGQTEETALGDLLVQMARAGKVSVMAHRRLDKAYRPWPRVKMPDTVQCARCARKLPPEKRGSEIYPKAHNNPEEKGPCTGNRIKAVLNTTQPGAT